MRLKMRLSVSAALFILWSSLLTPLTVSAAQQDERIERLDQYIEERQKAAHIPGLAVIVVRGGETEYEQYSGYSDVRIRSPITADTIFEMGSNSKAFTGLAIVQLVNEGTIKLEDPVRNYLPWFYMNSNGKKIDLTIGQLLHHTSAIPPDTIGHIPISNADDALEQTVRMLVGKELLQHKRLQPGEYYTYATINYDVLGLIIQQVTGMPYEDYMQDKIIGPLGLGSTFMHHEEAVTNGLATGYKLGLLGPHAYEAPRYRGNIPAGYVNSSPTDMARWMQIQLGAAHSGGIDPNLIALSHVRDDTVPPHMDGSSYAAGWSVYQSGSGEISHGGNNPNFSSYLVIRYDDKLGVAVMANMNSDHTEVIARGVMAIMRGQIPVDPLPDTYAKLDKIATSLLVVFTVVLLVLLYFVGVCLVEIYKGKRRRAAWNGRQAMRLIASLFFLSLYVSGLYYLPMVLLERLPWNALYVWAPYTVVPAIIAAAAFGIIYTSYYILTQLFVIQKEKPYVSLLMLGIISGFGNAFIIFVVNQTFGRDDNLTNGLLYYFALGILMYVYGQRYISTKLVTLTNNLVYDKRTELVGRILKTPYETLERMEDGRVHAVLNNDTEEVSRSINVIVSGMISSVTLICCFIYLGMLNIFALLLSIVVIITVAGLYFLLGSKAERLWKETREIQTVFFRLLNDMLKGFKELRLNEGKSRDFEAHLVQSSHTYRVKRTEGDVRFANVNVAGELLFTVVIGAVAFFFPVIFPNLLTKTVQAYVFVFLYMAGPVNGILNAYPMLIRIRISWSRIQELSDEMAQLQINEVAGVEQYASDAKLELAVRDVYYGYDMSGDHPFAAGPFDFSFRSGTITFITGGNGSGKTTLAKLITGLYKPNIGEIVVNGEAVPPEKLGGYFSAIFSDYYVFERLYGIDCTGQEDRITQLLRRLQLDDKVKVLDGSFSTTLLSTGQKKRLALLLAYIEDKPIYLFDEWAADQDPDYRRYFYHEILPELRAKGKCIIAITHDDRYFHIADALIKLDQGRQVQQQWDLEATAGA